MAVPARPKHLRLWFAIAVAASAVASGAGVYAYDYYSTHLTVTGVNWQMFVNRTSWGFLYPTPSSGCSGAAQCPNNATIGGVWLDVVDFRYIPTEFNLSVRNLTISSPFSIIDESPALPLFLNPGPGLAVIYAEIELPHSGGYYSPLGEIWISR